MILLDPIGDVPGGRRTIDEIAADIEKRIEGFERDASVTVALRAAMSTDITALGEVRAPNILARIGYAVNAVLFPFAPFTSIFNTAVGSRIGFGLWERGAVRSGLLEERVEGAPRLPAFIGARATCPVAGCEVVAAVRAFPVGDPLGVRLAALVVSRRFVVRAVAAGVQIRSTGVARVAKPHTLSAGELDSGTAGEAPHDERLRQAAAGCNRWGVFSSAGSLPIRGNMGNGEPIRPIFSSRAEDPALGEAIDAFVIGLAERIDHLQDAETEADLARLAGFARGLAADAEALGYEGLARVARGVEAAGRKEKADEAHAELVKLTKIAHRIRMGHRGAV